MSIEGGRHDRLGDARDKCRRHAFFMIPTEPRKSVPAPRVTLVHCLREVVLSPNAIRALSVALFFVVWEYFGRRMDPIFMAPPSAILHAAVQLTQSGALQKALVQTLWPFAVGMVLTVVVGTLIGVLMAQWRILEYILDPFINALYAVPRIALVPLIILWAGLEFTGKVTILVSVAIFPITVNTYAGIRDVRGSMLEIGRAYGATEWQIFTKIIMPAAVPFIMAGVRLSVGLAIIGIIVAEFFTAISGLGGMIVEYANVFATAKLFVPIIVIAIVGVVLTELVMWLERRLSRWRTLERERF
jgi:ABC-type nitrate/sulfonate/bicarbonate transport system permease component